ncbi:hypothetical protein GIB67_033700 [Kingdonia uniflora]|uniref:SEC7 domain-containing protein n=1 Tax=Kingdonia uniflora TaxID=39325 RepID=A0A7J7P4R9_9MAGN|nr:hypothetical protein GIB67_033700 [Kingdonia uniflora]
MEPALECTAKLFSLCLIRGEIDPSGSSLVEFRLIDAVFKCGGMSDDGVEIGILKVLISAVRSNCVLVRGECLNQVIKTCYNVYLGSVSTCNQICAKAVLAQICVIVFKRVEEDAMDVKVRTIFVVDLLELTDKSFNEVGLVQFVQHFIEEAMGVSNDAAAGIVSLELRNGEVSRTTNENGEGEGVHDESKIREDGFVLFKNLCKFSMKFSTLENPDDQILLRGKVLSLELLKIVMENGGPIWRTNERFLSAVKQYLCLSLLKNSAVSVMSIFQLQCSILMSLLSKFRSGLKAEIGIFFPMLILRVLENVLQPSFLQKMTVLNLLEKIFQDPQIIVDIFVNYDCDVDAPNLFERTVNGLLKTALGPPSGSTTTLSPAQDIAFRIESVKCLAFIIKSMGAWMDQQFRVDDFDPSKSHETDVSNENPSISHGEDGAIVENDLHYEANCELPETATFEQRRAFKIEFQKGISLFNRKPSKGIDFLVSSKKIGSSPEEIALFLKNTTGLNEAMIGDYLGEREDLSLKVMHAYVDSFNFEGMDFGQAIRFFLRGFRLPGEAQKIDRIMEKFAERYCKCNPSSFTSADTAYVLAYSVILLNTDAHNSTVKGKMSKADFVRNNRGIDDGKDLPEEYLGTLYDHIVKNEIKMKAESSALQSKQANSTNKLLGFEGILNLWKQVEEKPLGADGSLIRNIQEQFKAKTGISESVYYDVTDVAILRFMVEVCWAPMLAAFSMTLDQSDDKTATSQSLQGFRHAVHVTAVMGMQTQRDAFVTSVAKFTYLHCAADMKQKNVDAVKTIISIALEEGNYLQEAWEHILTCLSRFQHLQLLGEGVAPDASFLTVPPHSETEDRTTPKASGFPSLKKKGTDLQNSAVMAVFRGGSYDSSTTRGVNNSSGPVTPEQINNFISNLNLLDQIGIFELNHIFAQSTRLNSEAIVSFVKALCKVSMVELQSPTDPRVFSLTKIVEIAHYNMNRIRLVWTRIWNVLSNFFVSVGLSENLSVAIFVMDSLRQLAMKFLEREELANYNFQNEFLRPFVIVMQKSSSAEIRELIVRCVSQMVLSRVSNVKSGWRSVFTVFTTAAADERKNIILLAFDTVEKIVRDYFPYITETETTTFTDCVRCLTTFTNSRLNSDVSLNAIAFLRFCAVKLADGGLIYLSATAVADDASDEHTFTDKDDHVYYWVPLLTGLSKVTFDPRPAIRKSALEVLFNILKDHGHLFSRPFWIGAFNSVIFPIFNTHRDKRESEDLNEEKLPPGSVSRESEDNTWTSETCMLALQCLVDLFVSFFEMVRSQLVGVVSVLTSFICRGQSHASTGVAALVRLVGDLGRKLSEDEWREIFLAVKETAVSNLPEFRKLVRTMDTIVVPGVVEAYSELYPEHEFANDDLEDDSTFLDVFLQITSELYKTHQLFLSSANIAILLDIFLSVASHAHELCSDATLQLKLKKVCSILGVSDPPVVHFENESYLNYLNFLQILLPENSPSLPDDMNIESKLVSVCEDIIQIYLKCAGHGSTQQQSGKRPVPHWTPRLGSTKKEELGARTSLVVIALQVLCGLQRDSFRRYVSQFFPLLVDLVRSEHSSDEVQHVLSDIFQSYIGPIIMNS